MLQLLVKVAHECSVRRKQGVMEKSGWLASVRRAWRAMLKTRKRPF